MRYLMMVLVGIFAFASPCLAEFDSSEMQTMEQRIEVDSSEYQIVLGDVKKT